MALYNAYNADLLEPEKEATAIFPRKLNEKWTARNILVSKFHYLSNDGTLPYVKTSETGWMINWVAFGHICSFVITMCSVLQMLTSELDWKEEADDVDGNQSMRNGQFHIESISIWSR